MPTIKHIKRPYPQPAAGKWRVKCDCGWETWLPAVLPPARRAMPFAEAQGRLHDLFIGHLRPAERRTYLLVDTRIHTPADEETGEPEKIYGTFIMPESVGVQLVRAWEDDGVHMGEVRDSDPTKPLLTYPIGEIRNEAGSVWRLD